jgi:F-type H+-transporting ATPase subunit delta
MAELSTYARPYAKAAFGFALAAQDLAGWEQQLNTLAAVAGTEKVAAALASPSLTSAQQCALLEGVCGEALSANGRNFLHILAENKRLALLPEISAQFHTLKALQEKAVDVQVVSAFALDSQTEATLVTALAASLQRQVKVNTVVDQTLIGGVVVRTGDVVIDNSVRGRLNKLAATMNS